MEKHYLVKYDGFGGSPIMTELNGQNLSGHKLSTSCKCCVMHHFENGQGVVKHFEI